MGSVMGGEGEGRRRDGRRGDGSDRRRESSDEMGERWEARSHTSSGDCLGPLDATSAYDTARRLVVIGCKRGSYHDSEAYSYCCCVIERVESEVLLMVVFDENEAVAS
jgi:hypothetical protein